MLLFLNGVSGQNVFQRVDTVPVTVNGQLLVNPWTGGINFPNISSIDLNADGLKDLFLYDRHNERIVTFLNNGNTDYQNAWIYAPSYASQFPPISKWALLYDYNCDGREDLFTLSNSQNGISVYRNDFAGTLQWTLVSSSIQEDFSGNIINVFASSVSLPAFTDTDNDGDMDILGYNTLPDGRVAWHKNMSMETYGVCDSLLFNFASACWGDFTLRIGGSNSVGCFNCPCRTAGPGTVFEEPTFDPADAAKQDDTISGIFPMDIDGDNDIDLLVGDIASTNSLLIVNGGSTVTASMVSEDINFPNYDVPAEFNGFHYHSYIDVDNDNVKDLIVYPNEYENTEGLWFYKNIGTTAVPDFRFQTSTFLQKTMIEIGENATPALVDYDGDGLLDLVSGGSIFVDTSASYRTSLFLFKNTGTLTQPAFQFVTDDFAQISSLNLGFAYPTFGDLDGDGDQDLLIGNNNGNLIHFNNTAGQGNVMNLTLSSGQYFNIDVGNFAAPQLYDLDKDGVMDLLIGEKNGFVNYFRNRGSVSGANFLSAPDNDTLGCIVVQAPFTIDGYTVPFAYDSVGKTRLLLASELGMVDIYTGIDGNLGGCFTNNGSIVPVESSRIKFNLSVTGGDLNSDGFTDVVIGHSTGGMQIYYQYNPTANINEPKQVFPSVLLFPNPAHESVRLNFYHLDPAGNVLRVYDSIGKLMMEKEVTAEQMELQTAEWPEGSYLVQLVSGNRQSTSRIVIAH